MSEREGARKMVVPEPAGQAFALLISRPWEDPKNRAPNSGVFLWYRLSALRWIHFLDPPRALGNLLGLLDSQMQGVGSRSFETGFVVQASFCLLRTLCSAG